MNQHPKSHVTINTAIQFQDELPEKVDVAIIGGGVIGVFTALYLTRMSKSVIVLEKGRIAGEQSSRNWGWIRKHGRDAAELPIMIEADRLWHEANDQTNGQCGVKKAAVNFLSTTDKKQDQYEAWITLAAEHGVKSHMLTRKQIADIFTGQSDARWQMGTTTPDDARGEPWVAVPNVAKLAQQEGVKIVENCAVRMLDIHAGQIKGVITEFGSVNCEQVVLAGGAWSSLFARNHGIDLPQLAVSSSVVQTAPMAEFTSQNSHDEQLAIRRRADGGYSLAVCDGHVAFVGPDACRHMGPYMPALMQGWRDVDLRLKAPKDFPDAWGQARSWTPDQTSPFERNRVLEPLPNPKYIKNIITRFAERFPNIGAPKVQTAWAGMVDTMPDFVPVVDRAPELSGLIIATGMSGHGFGIGPGFAKIIANIATDKPQTHDISRFRMSRFTDGSKLNLGPSL